MVEQWNSDRDPEWAYASVDVTAEQLGDLLGELNRSGWQILGSRELEADSSPSDPDGTRRESASWMQVYAKHRF